MTQSQQNDPTAAPVAGPPVPRSVGGYLRGLGPGIVVGMAALGAGDLVDSSVSGANYGYALMWALAVALVSRYFITSALTKYQLCNSLGDETVLDGYARLWRGFPLLLSGASVLMVFVINTYQVRGAGTALFHLSGRAGGDTWGVFAWSLLVAVVSAVLALRRDQYRILEWMGHAAVVALLVPFVIAAVLSGPDLPAIVRGLAFELPPDKGVIGSAFVMLALMANFGGSVANLLYTYFVREKGWRGPAYRRLQMWDLVSGIASILVINLTIWIVAAETVFSTGGTIAGEDDLAQMMVNIIGPAGSTLFWIGLLGATFDGIGSLTFAATRMLVDSVHRARPHRTARHGEPTADPLFRWVQIGLLILLPLLFALPSAPDFVLLTIMSNALGVLIVPAITIGAIWFTTRRGWLLPGYGNRWWETAALVVIAGVNVWSTYQLVRNLAGQLVG